MKHIMQAVIERRRTGHWKAELAREEFDLIKQLDEGDISLDDWQRETRIEDAWDYISYEFPSQVQHFAARILPLLADAIDAELAAEATAA